jgi:hypothetical protein
MIHFKGKFYFRLRQQNFMYSELLDFEKPKKLNFPHNYFLMKEKIVSFKKAADYNKLHFVTTFYSMLYFIFI